MFRRKRARTKPLTAHESRPGARLRRWIRRVFFVIAALVTLAIGLLLGVVHNLERPWVKQRVQALVHSAAGVDIDYRAIRLRFLSGVEIDDLVVRSPSELRGVAPELAHVGRIDAAWSTALFTGAGRRVDRIALSDVALTVAVDGNGKTSFDALAPPNPTPATPTPLSHRANDLLSLAPSLPSADISGVSLTLIRSLHTDQGDVVERTSLHGLALHVGADSAAGEWHLRANVGSSAAPLDLDVARNLDGASAGDVHARLWLSADATSRDVATTLDLEVAKQTFVEHLEVARVLHAEARAHFDPTARTTSVSVEHTSVADGIATVVASLVLPDEGAPRINHAEGEIDFVRLLAIVPPAFVPVHASLRRGHVQYGIDDLALDALPRLNDGANVAIDGDFTDVKVAPGANVAQPYDVAVAAAKLSAHVVPGPDASLRARASIALDGGRIGLGRQTVLVDGLTLDADATQASGGAVTGTATLGFAAIEMGNAPRVAAKSGKLGVHVTDLLLDQDAPLATHGDVALTSELASLDVQFGTNRAVLDGLTLGAHTQLAGHAPWALDVDVRTSLLRLFEGGGKVLVRVPVHVEANVTDVSVEPQDLKDPKASSGKGHVVVDAGDVHLQADATKAHDAVDFTLDSNARTLEAVRPFLPSDVATRLPVEKMALALQSRGHVEGMTNTAPSIRQHTEIRLDRPSFDHIAARALDVVLDSKGTPLHHELEGEVRFEGLALLGTGPSDDRIKLGAAIELDRETPAVRVRVDQSGRAQAKVSTSVTFDRARRAVTYEVEGDVAHLSPLAPLASKVHGLDGVDLSQLEVTLSTRGTLRGVVSAIDRDGGIHFEQAPKRTASLEGTIGVKAKHVGWSGGDASFTAPSFALEATLHADDKRRTVESHVDADEFHFASGPHSYDVAGLSDHLSATIDGDLAEPSVEAKQQLSVRLVKQDLLPTYPVGNTTLALAVRRSPDGVVHVSNFEVANGAGGTSIALKGAIDPSEYHRRLSLRGELHQDLARLSNAPERLAARGTANVALRVESPDLSIFRTVADVRVEGADVRLPRSGISIEGADGEVPITVSVRAGPRGIRMLREDQDNPYSSLRFADQHPLLSRSSFISIRHLTSPQVSIAPLVGNLQIEQNIISLRQFEMGIRGGRVTGRCALDWNGQNSTLDMHVRADSVQSSHGEPFTGSAALVVSAGEHSIEGRADVLQIGERHLLDLLDLQDPFHADAGINKIRSALAFGYPDKLRVTFNHGFASVHVSFGGLARLVSVGDLRGIPIGPLIDQFIPPFLPSGDEP